MRIRIAAVAAALAIGAAGLAGCGTDQNAMDDLDRAMERVECAEAEAGGYGHAEVERLRSLGEHADAEALSRELASGGC